MASKPHRQNWPSERKLFNGSLTTGSIAALAVLLTSFFLSSTAAAQSPPIFKIVTDFPACGNFKTTIYVDVDTQTGAEDPNFESDPPDPRNRLGGAGFTLNYDPSILTNPTVSLGADAQAAGFVVTTNPSNPSTANGQLGIILDSGNFVAYSPPDRRMLIVRFDVVPLPPPGTSPITFGGSPTPLSASNPDGILYQPFTFVNGNLTVGGTACTTSAGVTIGGRVLTPGGAGIRNARVVITDPEGNRRTVTTSSLGYYQFEDVGAGKTYVVSVASRRYRFSPRAVQVTDNLTDLDFVGME